MRRASPRAAVSLLAAALAFAGCANDLMVSQWTNPAYTSPSIKRIIVAAASEETAVRRNLEDEFVARLKASGVDAQPSYRHIPDDQRVDEAKLKQAAKAAGADAALLVRAVGAEQRTEYYPGHYPAAGTFGPHPDAAWRGFYGGPALRRYDVVNSEATLYDVGKNEVIWTGTAAMVRPVDMGAAIKEYVDGVVAALREKNILRRN
jgi:hypothetical protein